MASQIVSDSKQQFRAGDGDEEEEEDSEETLDPRVKGELDRLNSSTAEINRLEQDLEDLQATFRQTLTESAYILKSQATFLGKCINQARPYYDAVRKAKQSQIETQKAALKYERACSAHQAAKKMLTIAEQRLVSTSKEHKVLDPTWQEMLNQAVLKVMESDKERALSEREHLETARAFSQAGSQVTELRTKLKSAISKSRPYFDLKMKYDQILEAHKKQVEITQEGLQEAKQKYSLALKNLEGISEEIHEMRKSRDSLDTILHEREEGVGAESPVGDLSRDAIRPGTDFNFKELDGRVEQQNKPCYGFKIALVSASSQAQAGKVSFDEVESGMPVGERDGDPEGCSSVDEQQLDEATRHQLEDISKREESKADSVNYQGANNSANLNNSMEAIDSQGAPLVDEKDQQHISPQATDPESCIAEDEMCSTTEPRLTNQQLLAGKRENMLGRDSHICQAETPESANMTESLEQRSSCDTVNENDLGLLVEDPTNNTTDTCENHKNSMEEETMASKTPTEVKSEVSIVPLTGDTADKEATRTIVDTAESDSMEEAAEQQVLNKDFADGSY